MGGRLDSQNGVGHRYLGIGDPFQYLPPIRPFGLFVTAPKLRKNPINLQERRPLRLSHSGPITAPFPFRRPPHQAGPYWIQYHIPSQAERCRRLLGRVVKQKGFPYRNCKGEVVGVRSRGFCLFSLKTGVGIGGVFGGDWSAVGCFDLCNLPNSGEKENAVINLVNTIRKLVPQDGVQAL
jgi:hypothetical protein